MSSTLVPKVRCQNRGGHTWQKRLNAGPQTGVATMLHGLRSILGQTTSLIFSIGTRCILLLSNEHSPKIAMMAEEIVLPGIMGR